jgi:hypothetical protein
MCRTMLLIVNTRRLADPEKRRPFLYPSLIFWSLNTPSRLETYPKKFLNSFYGPETWKICIDIRCLQKMLCGRYVGDQSSNTYVICGFKRSTSVYKPSDKCRWFQMFGNFKFNFLHKNAHARGTDLISQIFQLNVSFYRVFVQTH